MKASISRHSRKQALISLDMGLNQENFDFIVPLSTIPQKLLYSLHLCDTVYQDNMDEIEHLFDYYCDLVSIVTLQMEQENAAKPKGS